MAKVIDILQEFARRVSDTVVQSIADNDDTSNQLLGYVLAACGQIRDECDWKSLRRSFSVKTVKDITVYPYPDDYDKILTWSIYIPELNVWIISESADEALKRKISGLSGDTSNQYREVADGFKFTYPFSPNLTLEFEYKSKYFVKSKDSSGNIIYTDVITKDDDEILFDKELVILAARAARAQELESDSYDSLVQQYLSYLDKQKNKQTSKMNNNAFYGALDTRTLSAARVRFTGGGSY